MNPVLQLIGVPVIGLEPEFQPVVSHLLPQIVAHKQDIRDMHLQVHDVLTYCCHFACVEMLIFFSHCHICSLLMKISL